jgi:hypothetical protein
LRIFKGLKNPENESLFSFNTFIKLRTYCCFSKKIQTYCGLRTAYQVLCPPYDHIVPLPNNNNNIINNLSLIFYIFSKLQILIG